jgi:predicted lipoprotein with Yx(FWY)xxD motif
MRATMRTAVLTLAVAATAALAACGDDEPADAGGGATAPVQAAETMPARSAPAKAPRPRGTTIVLRDSEFGPMLFNARRQAIYIFENDRRNRTVCYGECAAAWPPVYTRGTPRAANGVRRSLLGTIRRRDGRRQVTYAGKPLYYYANEGPGEVRCHNVDLNGGLWWVVGRDGRRRP